MGIAERREREKEQRRNDIIDAAEKVFFSNGMESATMDDVAEAAELSKGTLYLYFKSKEEIYLAIHLRGNRILTTMFRDAVDKHKLGIDKVRSVGDAYFEYSRKYPDYFNAMIYYESRDIIFDDQNSIASDCMTEGKATLEVLVEALHIGVNDGSIRSDIDPLKTAVSLWGQSTGIIQILALKENLILQQHNISAVDIVNYTYELIHHSLKA